ncbi:hypothetical protein DUY81_08580 [Acidipropionibacterium acidipropionici]|uniref:Uncharacterized protein n=1 Tax=Acidipropionibacterium acidipropionici TaxID=1748 RepID=A0AAC9AMX8_9ACTN|nr:hypothetical protein [Acidipropionibacterium acidipropionici]AMS04632.1 hypothetical protein AXH35_03200 [Acidipropionibacterium acidipropionici]AOZ46121.1 hypothetical protein A8L58_04665 [Acidipropionibacterium acidipropionici]AZP37849.1 hypothetical protein DUY81_08580 [Acidipropionibacterium acidipropionici]
MTTASVTLTESQMSILGLTLQWSASPMIAETRVVPSLVKARQELVQLLEPFDGEVTVTGPTQVSGVEAEKVTVRNPARKRDRDSVAEHDDLTRLAMAAARVIGDRRHLISLDAQAGTSGEDRDVAVAHLERSLNDLADVLSVVINHQEHRNA